MVLTEGIRYTGSKREIIPRILQLIQSHCPTISTVLDGCAGTTRVSQALKHSGYTVRCNDLAEHTQVFGQCYLLNRKPASYYQPIIDHLNNIQGTNGWFSQNYGGLVTNNADGNAIQADGKKRPWQRHNMEKLDAILSAISIEVSDPVERSVLLTATMIALDKVDNTMGHQVAYLKQWSKRSYETLQLQVPALITDTLDHSVHQESIQQWSTPVDLAYIDPPYGTNNPVTRTTRVRYRSYYHLWRTICINDQPSLHGAALRRFDSSSDRIPGAISAFESTKSEVVFTAFKELFESLPARWIMVSYSSKSKLPAESLRELIRPYKLICFERFAHKEHAMKHSITSGAWKGDRSKNEEFLILFEK